MSESANPRSIDQIKTDLKRLLVENLSLEGVKPQDIRDDAELFGEDGLGLDSLDGVEVVVVLHRNFGVDVKAMQKRRDAFQSINTLAQYLLANATK